MKRALVILSIVLLLCGCAPPKPWPRLVVKSVKGDALELVVENTTGHAIAVPTNLKMSGYGGGDIVAVIVDGKGKLYPPCANIEMHRAKRDTIEIRPGAAHKGWSGPLGVLRQWHCLAPGLYSARFLLVLPGEESTVSEAIQLRVLENGESVFASH